MTGNTLYHGDNLDILRRVIPDESIDLVYLDPPFNTRRNRRFESQKFAGHKIKAYRDSWRWDAQSAGIFAKMTAERGKLAAALQGFHLLLGDGMMLAYLTMMAPRLTALHRVLKPNGSLYLHCDPAAGAHLRLLLDAIFGAGNFRNEIIWLYKTGGTSKRWFGRKHDSIYFYSKSDHYTFHPQKEKSYLSHRYGFSNIDIQEDENGVYTTVAMRDVWDVPALRGNQPEALGYPAQKPEALLERIIRASSNPGDCVLDPFCGSGTTLAVAQRLERRWIGMDAHEAAIETTQQRLQASAVTLPAAQA